MILVVGEILFDIFPDFRRPGGAPFNFAFHLKKLGFPVRFFSRVGADEPGNALLAFIASCGFDPDDIQRDPDFKTGYVGININQRNEHHFRIYQNVAYDHIQYTPAMTALLQEKPELIYFGTLIRRTREGAHVVHRLLSDKPEKTKAFCDINLRPDCWTATTVTAAMDHADILKLNHEELALISSNIPGEAAASLPDIQSPSQITLPETGLPLPSPSGADLTGENTLQDKAVTRIIKRHNLEAVILTRGAEGSDWYSRDAHHKSPAPHLPSLQDTVGAGDAHAAMAAACYLNGLPVESVLTLATAFAGRICRIKGALPENDAVYNEFRKKMRP